MAVCVLVKRDNKLEIQSIFSGEVYGFTEDSEELAIVLAHTDIDTDRLASLDAGYSVRVLIDDHLFCTMLDECFR